MGIRFDSIASEIRIVFPPGTTVHEIVSQLLASWGRNSVCQKAFDFSIQDYLVSAWPFTPGLPNQGKREEMSASISSSC